MVRFAVCDLSMGLHTDTNLAIRAIETRPTDDINIFLNTRMYANAE